MTRPYHRKNEPEPVVTYEFVEPEPIIYHYGKVRITLTGFLAWLYRGMSMMYGGEDEASERFWFLFHKRPEEKKKTRRHYPARQSRLQSRKWEKLDGEILP